MAHVELYYFDYRDYLHRKTTVKILQDGYTNATTEILAAGEPVIIETKSDNDYLFNQIYGSECVVNIISTINFQFVSLFTANAFKNKVEIWMEPEPDEPQELFWSGFILPDQYSEPLDFDKNYGVTLVARDGLGGLKNIDFLTDSKTPYVGKRQVIKIIAEILKKTKLDLNINWGINLIENDAPITVTGDTFENIYLDYAVFYQDKTLDCEYVLTQILQSFGARIIQASGEWWIERVPMYLANQNIHKYDKNGAYLSSSVVANQINYTGKYDTTNNQLFFAEKKGNLEINPAYKEFEINQKFGKLKSILVNNSFEQFTLSLPGWSISSLNQNWNIIERVSIGENWSELDKYCFYSYSTTGQNGLILKSQSIKVKLSPTKGLRISFEGRTKQRLGKILVQIGNKYLAIKGGGEYLTDGNSNPIDADCELSNTITKIWWGTGRNNNLLTYNMYFIPTSEIDDFLTIRFYMPDGGSSLFAEYWLDNIKVDFIDQSESSSYPEDATYNIIVDEENNYIPELIISILGDLPELSDNEDIYIGGYWYFDGLNYVPTSSWSYYASSRTLALMPLLGEAINDQYRNPKHKISGLLVGNFKLNKAVFIPMLQNRLYLPIRTTMNMKYCKTEIEAIELVPETENEGGIVWGTHEDNYVVESTDTLIKI